MSDIYLKSYGFLIIAIISLRCSELPSEKSQDQPDTLSRVTGAPVAPESALPIQSPSSQAVLVSKKASFETASKVGDITGKPDQPLQTDQQYLASAMNFRPNGQDQSAELNRLLQSIPASATFVFDTGPEFILGSPLILTKPIQIEGRNTQLTYSGPAGVSIINLQSSGISLRNLKITAGYEKYNPKSFIIGTSGNSNSNPFSDIIISGCTISGFSGVAVNLRYVRDFKVLNNRISGMPYAGVACYSVTNGTIDGNTIKGMTAEGTAGANAYGITIQQLGQDSVSRGVRISNNNIQGVPWEGIDTHGSEYLYIYNNELKDCAVGLAMVSTRYKSPQSVILANNLVENRGNTKSAIRFDGRANARNASGIIVNNKLVGQHIRLENTSNLFIFGNEVRESETGYGIYLSGQNNNTNIQNNSIQDVWSKANGNSYAIYIDNDSNTAVIDGNRMLTKGFRSPNNTNNKFGFKINEKSKFCHADIGSNDFSSAKMKDYVEDNNIIKLSKGPGKARKADYHDIEDRSVTMLSDMSAQAKLILPELSKATDGLSFVLTNPSRKPVSANVTLTSLKDPDKSSTSLAATSTTIFYYDYYSGKIWIM